MGRAVHQFSRRKFLASLGAGLAGAALTRGGFNKLEAAAGINDPKHLAWVWQFDEDGPRDAIRHVLSQNGLGIILKTHDGTNWMGRWDQSPDAVRGPADIRNLANYFESNGIPFHTWAVVKGQDPMGEARMCAEALANGARSMVLDLEPNEGGNYWQGGPAEAVAFGKELRRLAPTARLSVAPDPRPWQVNEVPMAEFAAFCNEIAPQTYWKTFNSAANYRLLGEYGFQVGPDGVTPELILDVSARGFARFNRPIRPIGQGTADRDGWQRFVRHAYRLGMQHVSVWRYGTATGGVWPLLREMAPAAPPPPPATPTPVPTPAAPARTASNSYPSYRWSPQSDANDSESVDKVSSPTPRARENGLFGTKSANRDDDDRTERK